MASAASAACPDCGTQIAAVFKSCPRCHRLVHAEELASLARSAEAATAAGELAAALSDWRRALELLPPGSRQYQQVSQRVAELSRRVDAAPAARPSWAKRAGPLGLLALLVWKFKFAIGFVLTKGKLLLLGLTKSSTLFSMLLSLGVYWAAWGWRFALGLVVSMYVHEMGHVAALQRFGIKATAPMFVPGFGAFVRLKQYPADPREDARVGLAGPIWGLFAALACYAAFLGTGAAIWAAIARVGAWINLFNLLPIWQLDGGRGFRALSRGQRSLLALVLLGLWAWSSEGLLGLLALVAAFRAFGSPGAGDRRAFAEYLLLAVTLSALTRLSVPLSGAP